LEFERDFRSTGYVRVRDELKWKFKRRFVSYEEREILAWTVRKPAVSTRETPQAVWKEPWKSVDPQFHPRNETSFDSSCMLKCCLISVTSFS
jgi:hypothetical protein